MTTELKIKQYYVFFEDINRPAFGCSWDDAGVFYIRLYRLRISIYGRKFNSQWQ